MKYHSMAFEDRARRRRDILRGGAERRALVEWHRFSRPCGLPVRGPDSKYEKIPLAGANRCSRPDSVCSRARYCTRRRPLRDQKLLEAVGIYALWDCLLRVLLGLSA